MIDVQIPYGSDIDFSKLLTQSSHSPHYVAIDVISSDLLETRYTTDDGRYLKLEMHDEIENSGFGSRSTGGQMRNKAVYLMEASPTLPLIISWAGVKVIASSYADEFIGKLFVDIGPIAFMSRVMLKNMEPIVQNIINRAIMQRTVQAMKVM